jgi:prevent-host-death family protein
MRSVSISVTEAARNFADCINRARYQGTTFILHKNGVPVARIAPVERNSKMQGEFEAPGAETNAAEPQGEEAQTPKSPVPEIW